jgi:predicted amidohydrolase
MGLSICYDLRFSELYNFYARKNVDLILIPAAFLVPTGKMHWNILIKARAIESQCFVAAAAQSGGHKNSRGDRRETFGNSLVIDPWGAEMLCLGDKGSRVGVVVLNPDKIEVARRQIPMSKHRRFKL